MIDIIKMIVKSTIATIRWGALTEADEKLVWDASLKELFRANYIRKTPLSQKNIITLEK